MQVLNMEHSFKIYGLILSVSLLCAVGAGHPVESDDKITSANGISYWVDFESESSSVTIHGHNPTDQRIPTGVVVQVDDAVAVNKDEELLPNETWDLSVNIHDSLDALEANHSIVVSTFGASIEFNFTREINASNPGPVPTPHIQNVQIKNGTIDGEPSAVAEVTVANPSKQTYPTKLMVHTTGTDGSFYPAAVPPGETRTITVELLDERGARIAGEARLYTEGLNKREGAMDQVEFVGRAGAETRHWNTTYEPVRPPWVDDSYRYRNSSVTGDGGLAPGEAGSWVVYAAAGVVLLVWLVRRFR